MKRLRRLVCRVRGHQTVGSPGTGGGRLTVCLRCYSKLAQVEWDRPR